MNIYICICGVSKKEMLSSFDIIAICADVWENVCSVLQ